MKPIAKTDPEDAVLNSHSARAVKKIKFDDLNLSHNATVIETTHEANLENYSYYYRDLKNSHYSGISFWYDPCGAYRFLVDTPMSDKNKSNSVAIAHNCTALLTEPAKLSRPVIKEGKVSESIADIASGPKKLMLSFKKGTLKHSACCSGKILIMF